MNSITANELKNRGVTAIKALVSEFDEPVAVTVRGRTEYVVLSTAQFDAFAQFELQVALDEAKNDMANGNYTSNVDEHFEQLHRSLDE